MKRSLGVAALAVSMACARTDSAQTVNRTKTYEAIVNADDRTDDDRAAS